MPSTDPEKRRQHSATYYQRHRAELLARAASYREAHRAELVEKNRRYRLRKGAEAQQTTTERKTDDDH